MSKEEPDIVEVVPLRKLLQQFNEDLGQYINAEERYKLGRVLTIVDAAIADPEQRKAIKDLVNTEWWNRSARPSDSPMTSPHSDLRAICEVLDFKLYVPNAGDALAMGPGDDLSWIKKRYQDTLATRK